MIANCAQCNDYGYQGSYYCGTFGLACLGLFGLAAFTTMQRTKEIGSILIRWVFGFGGGKENTDLVMDINNKVLLSDSKFSA